MAEHFSTTTTPKRRRIEIQESSDGEVRHLPYGISKSEKSKSEENLKRGYRIGLRISYSTVFTRAIVQTSPLEYKKWISSSELELVPLDFISPQFSVFICFHFYYSVSVIIELLKIPIRIHAGSPF